MNFHLQTNQVCTYKYAAEQQHFGGDQQQTIAVGAVVEVSCNSGKFLSMQACASAWYALALARARTAADASNESCSGARVATRRKVVLLISSSFLSIANVPFPAASTV